MEIKDENGNTALCNLVEMYRGDKKDIEMIKFLVSKGNYFDTKTITTDLQEI